MEIWKPIKNYEDLYMISNYGNIKSLDRTTKNGSGYYIKKGKILKKHINNKGYEYVRLKDNKTPNKQYIHRLVAQAFIPNPDNKPQINHKDCNPLNNNVSNLEWCTRKENMSYMSKLGRSKKEGIWLAKITYKNMLKGKRVAQMDLKNNKIYVYPTIQSVKQNGFLPGQVCKCCKGIQKKHKGYEWKYYEDFKRIYCR